MFKNREEAGLLLAEQLKKRKDLKDGLVVAIPRGGVVVGKIVADQLHLPLSGVVIKKIGAPGNPELAVGAIGIDNIVFWEEDIIKSLGLTDKDRKRLRTQKKQEVEKKQSELSITLPKVKDKVVILVDDGVATGATVVTGAKVLRHTNAKKIILATPVISEETLEKINPYFDEIIYIRKPFTFYAVGEFYEDFPQVEDEEVKEILNIKNKK